MTDERIRWSSVVAGELGLGDWCSRNLADDDWMSEPSEFLFYNLTAIREQLIAQAWGLA